MAYIPAKIKVKGQLLQKMEWRQTDWWTDTTDFITFRANAVSNDQSSWKSSMTFKLAPCTLHLTGWANFLLSDLLDYVLIWPLNKRLLFLCSLHIVTLFKRDCTNCKINLNKEKENSVRRGRNHCSVRRPTVFTF